VRPAGRTTHGNFDGSVAMLDQKITLYLFCQSIISGLYETLFRSKWWKDRHILFYKDAAGQVTIIQELSME
jgi:hypothetical protein